MNAIEATLLPYQGAEPTVVDDPEKRLLARIALAEREFAEAKCSPASEVVSDLYEIANRA
ncbi:MAG: hypothetical protein IJ111_06185 [Eggerthellaceae bacterium]|nr:hypothetical protein [Eggerthellaceae bacterium]